MLRYLIPLALVTPLFFGSYTPEAEANGWGHRRAIRQMHILDRPNRPGHFIGNSIRARHHAHHGSYYGHRYSYPSYYGYGYSYGYHHW